MAQNPRKGKDHPDAKAVQEQREERAKATADAVKRMESTQPTPTQEENDLAKIGIVVDEKEDDGSGPDIVERRSLLAGVPLSPHGHESREARERVERAEQERQQRSEQERQSRRTRPQE